MCGDGQAIHDSNIDVFRSCTGSHFWKAIFLGNEKSSKTDKKKKIYVLIPSKEGNALAFSETAR